MARRPVQLRHPVLLLALLCLTVLTGADDVDCGPHGVKEGTLCKCTTPLPNDNQPGYAGDVCTQVVNAIVLDGQDVQATCPEGQQCNRVSPMGQACFAASIAEMFDSSFHFGLTLTADVATAPLTIRGMLSVFKEVTDPQTGAQTMTTEVYPNSSSHYDFEAHTTPQSATTTLSLRRYQLGTGNLNGLFLCVSSPVGLNTFKLRAATHSCPFTFKEDGSLETCSGRGATQTCEHGVCTCNPPYAPPSPMVHPGQGFESCSTALNDLTAAQPAAVTSQAAGRWSFWRYQVVPTAYETAFVAAATADTKGALEVYIRREQLPSSYPGTYDATSCPHMWSDDLETSASVKNGDAEYATGTWYVGVFNKGPDAVTYTMTAVEHGCPNDCSGHGTCDATAHTCQCTTDAGVSASGPACADLHVDLTLDTPASGTLPASATFLLQGLQGVASSPSARLVLEASYGSAPALPGWASSRPTLLVAAPGADAAAPVTAANAGAQMVLAEPDKPHVLQLGGWLVKDGAVRVVLVNPFNDLPPYKLTYSLKASVRAACLNDCSGHGTCEAGACKCQEGFGGGDCSVDTSGLAHPCPADSVTPLAQPDKRATCWAPCLPDGSGYDTSGNTCKDFTCDETDGAGNKLRRKGSANECVVDTCMPGLVNVTDPTGQSACSKKCVCPEDGGACTLNEACEAGTRQCLNGYSLVDDICVPPPPCMDGALEKKAAVTGGQSYALCMCSGSPATSCAFITEPVVVCSSGYVLKGTSKAPKVLKDGSKVYTGGACAKAPKPGTSGGMVFFYCLLSIALAAGLAWGSKHGVALYEDFKYGRLSGGNGQSRWEALLGRGTASGLGSGGGNADDW